MLSALKAGLSYFAIVFGAGFVLGTARILLVAPVVGETAAVVVKLPIMLAVSWIACGWIVRRCSVPTRALDRAVMGGSAFVFLMLAELGLAALLGRSAGEFTSSLATLPGALGLTGQTAFATFPLLQLRPR